MNNPNGTPANGQAEQLIDQLTLEEQVSLLSGEDFWSLPAIPRLGINKMRVTDGPNGARGSGSLFGGVTAACFPCGISIGATWNTALTKEIAEAIAEEVKSKGAHLSLGPTVNVQRSCTNGRNFECYSEDPELSASLTTAYIQGLQEQGIGSAVKHFAGNESEIERTTIDSVIDERSLREIYLRPFEDAVKKAGTWSMMSSYNKLNGTYTAESGWLLTQVLRQEWGFDGALTSDWFGSRSTAPTINAGLNMEMPGPARDRGQKLIDAVNAGEVSDSQVRQLALEVLRLMERVGSLDDDRPFVEKADNRAEHRALIRRAGAEGTVLLKNENAILPLKAEAAGKIAVIGPNANVARILGGGSAQLNPHYTVTPLEAISARTGAGNIEFAEGCSNYRFEPLYKGNLDVEFFANRELRGEPVHTETMTDGVAFWIPPFGGNKVEVGNFSARVTARYEPQSTGTHHLGFHCAGLAKIYLDNELILDLTSSWQKGRTFFEEGCDEQTVPLQLEAGREYKIHFDFMSRDSDNLTLSAWRLGISRPLGDSDLIHAVAAASEADTAILFVGRSGEWDTEGSDLENISLPGRQDELISKVLEANPNTVVVLQTGGPVEMPWIDQAPAVLQAWYPGQECGNAIADVLFGDVEPTGRLPQSFPIKWSDNPTAVGDARVYPGQDGAVEYREKLNIGYRHYDATGIKTLFPFGFGLGYTSFTLSELNAQVGADGSVKASVKLTNTGERQGTTVVQLYVSELNSKVERPVKELKQFSKVTLEAGTSATVEFELGLRDFAYCDVDSKGWRVDAGQFRLSAGFNAEQIEQACEIELTDQFTGY